MVLFVQKIFYSCTTNGSRWWNFRNQDKPQENTGCRSRTKIHEADWAFGVVSAVQSSLCCRWGAEWLPTGSELLWWSKGRIKPLSLQHIKNYLSSFEAHHLSPWNHKHSAHLKINLTQAALDGQNSTSLTKRNVKEFESRSCVSRSFSHDWGL